MALSFLNAKELDQNLKVTIQKSGKLGFTAPTAQALAITTDTYFRFALDENKTLFMVVSLVPGEDAYRAYKGGEYFSLKTAPLFDHLGYDYATAPIMFELKREASLDAEACGKVFSMKRRAARPRKTQPTELPSEQED